MHIIQAHASNKVLNFAFNFGYTLRPLKNSTLDKPGKQSMLVLAANELTSCLILDCFAVIEILRIEKFLRELSFSSIISTDIWHSTCRFLIKWLLIKKSVN